MRLVDWCRYAMALKKVVVSAAGQGTRMLELSKDKSKHLINVGSRPFLAYLLDNIIEAGYREVIMVVGFREDMIREFLKTYDAKGTAITLINQFEVLGPKEKMYGTACPLMCVKDVVGKENFISLVGDNFYTVEQLKAMNIDDQFCYVAGVESQTPEKFGVLLENNGFLEKIVEKPREFIGNFINTSLYKFTPDIFEAVFTIGKSVRGEYEITDAISLLAKDKKVKVKKFSDYWMDFGHPDDIEKFQEFLNKKQ